MVHYKYRVKVGKRTVARTVKRPRILKVSQTSQRKATTKPRKPRARGGSDTITTYYGDKKIPISKLEKMDRYKLRHTLLDASVSSLKKLSKRKDKVGRVARMVLEWEETGKILRLKRRGE